MKIEVSNGEIIDKLTIIEIKLKSINDESKLFNLRKEYELLSEVAKNILSNEHELYKALFVINSQLWNIEDSIRDLERRKDFGEKFIETARSVYVCNDKRSEIKKQINKLTGSNLVEEKSYEKY